MAPNKKLNKVVEKINQGTVFYKFLSGPGQIVDIGSRWSLKKSSYSLNEGEKLVTMGYRHCPSHWEWVLILRHYQGEPWLDSIQQEFADGFGGITEIQSLDMPGPAVSIVREPNDWPSKGGMSEQISVYLKSDERTFQWTPTVDEIVAQLRLLFGLYEWDGPTGLKSEIFDRI